MTTLIADVVKIETEFHDEEPFSRGGMKMTITDADGVEYKIIVDAADPFAAKQINRCMINTGHDAAMKEMQRELEEAA